MIVIGGGDTGADCVANSHREGAASVTQIELVGQPPHHRPDEITPWPRWPMKLRIPYALKEGGHRDFAISTTKFTGNGNVEEIHWATNSGVPPFEPVAGTEESPPGRPRAARDGLPRGPNRCPSTQLGVEKDERSNAKAPTPRHIGRRRLRRGRREAEASR